MIRARSLGLGIGKGIESCWEGFGLDTPRVAVIMGSRSDWEVMRHAVEVLDQLAIAHEVAIVSAHRTPDRMFAFAETAQARGLEVIIAGAGGAAHLPGMVAAKTLLPVIGVPVPSQHVDGMDSLLSIVQMPGGIPVATVAIGRPGAVNAALLAARMLAIADPAVREALQIHRAEMEQSVMRAHDALLEERGEGPGR